MVLPITSRSDMGGLRTLSSKTKETWSGDGTQFVPREPPGGHLRTVVDRFTRVKRVLVLIWTSRIHFTDSGTPHYLFLS